MCGERAALHAGPAPVTAARFGGRTIGAVPIDARPARRFRLHPTPTGVLVLVLLVLFVLAAPQVTDPSMAGFVWAGGLGALLVGALWPCAVARSTSVSVAPAAPGERPHLVRVGERTSVKVLVGGRLSDVIVRWADAPVADSVVVGVGLTGTAGWSGRFEPGAGGGAGEPGAGGFGFGGSGSGGLGAGTRVAASGGAGAASGGAGAASGGAGGAGSGGAGAASGGSGAGASGAGWSGARSALVDVPLVPVRRGRFVRLALVVTCDAPFGMWTASRTVVVDLPRPLVVGPAPMPATELPGLPVGSVGDIATTAVGHGGDTTRSVRPYVAGDPAHLVHWPTSARTGTIVVREMEPPADRAVAVVVDLGPGPGAGSGSVVEADARELPLMPTTALLADELAVERAVAKAATIVSVLHDSGVHVLLATADPAPQVAEVGGEDDRDARLSVACAGLPGAVPPGWPVLRVGIEDGVDDRGDGGEVGRLGRSSEVGGRSGLDGSSGVDGQADG